MTLSHFEPVTWMITPAKSLCAQLCCQLPKVSPASSATMRCAGREDSCRVPHSLCMLHELVRCTTTRVVCVKNLKLTTFLTLKPKPCRLHIAHFESEDYPQLPLCNITILLSSTPLPAEQITNRITR